MPSKHSQSGMPRVRGQYDSSATRVAPIFGALTQHGGDDWVQRLLALVAPERLADLEGRDLKPVEVRYGDDERGLTPPGSLLEWLVQNVEVLPSATDASMSAAWRRRLVAREAEAVAEGLRLLRESRASSGWWILEGTSYPDVCIETPDAVIVVEGKRTESGPTTQTTWMPGRHQMLRHLDAAWEIARGRRLFGFFVVEANPDEHASEVPSVWRAAVEETRSAAAIGSSLPHRSEELRAEIVGGFFGATTWQAIVGAFGLDRAHVLPKTIGELDTGSAR